MNILQDRTVNIMMIAKRFPLNEVKSEIAKYMAEECGCPADKYTDSTIFSIVRSAFFDWLWCCDKSRTMALIRTYFDCVDELSQLDRMLIALALSQVAEIDNDGNCHEICGFHETDFTKRLKATEKDIQESINSLDGLIQDSCNPQHSKTVVRYTPDKDGWRVGAYVKDKSMFAHGNNTGK